MPSIHELITNRNWKRLLGLIDGKKNRHQFLPTNRDDDGLSPMHLACMDKSVPVKLIQKMLDVSDDNLTCQRLSDEPHDRFDISSTPLHFACEKGSAKVVKLLLARAGESAKKLVTNKNDVDPLLYVFSGKLVPTFSSCIGEEEEYSEEEVVRFIRGFASVESLQDLERACSEVRDAWEKATILIFVMSKGAVETFPDQYGEPWSIVRSIVSIGKHRRYAPCPPYILWFALKLYPEQAQWADRCGNLPLHIVCSKILLIIDVYHLGEDHRNEKENAIIRQIQVSTTSMLLDVYPDGAKVRNKDGRLPLHLAAAHGLGWEGQIENLVAAYPDAILMCDPVTRLYPFMLAATDWEDEEDSDALNSIFFLLKENPELVKSGIQKTTYEKYLEKKLAWRDAEIAKKDAMLIDAQQGTCSKKRKSVSDAAY